MFNFDPSTSLEDFNLPNNSDGIRKDVLYKILGAIANVDRSYYKYINNCGLSLKHGCENDSNVDEIEDQLERVFAYELYHQLRLGFQSFHIREYCINGEPGKKLTPNDPIDGRRYIPDIVIHGGQGDSVNQHAIIEIKRACNVSGVGDDINKIIKYINELEFKLGMIICVDSDWDKFVNEIKKWHERNPQKMDQSLKRTVCVNARPNENTQYELLYNII